MPPKIKIITGPIGSGKTTILKRIKESYERKEIFIGQKSEYDIFYFDTLVLYGVVFLQTANDLKIINNQTYSNCLTFYYQMISNINFENAEVTILKVIPPIDRCMEQINQRGRSFEVGSLSIDYVGIGYD
ncbi:hypothetical protein ACTFIZ_000055 [Dictyostelium cf. discoideum]